MKELKTTKENFTKDITKKKKLIKKVFIAIWILFGVGVISVATIFILISTGEIGYMPPIDDLNNPIDKYASQIISEDGVTLGTYSLDQNNRIYTDYNQLPKDLVNALIATEDKRFYDHSGVDARSLGRAIVVTGLMGDKTGGGGSTISQQLAKLLYSKVAQTRGERVMQKPIEWVIAAKLERLYTKDEIINLYLNKFDFLYNAVGIQSAANVYFGKNVSELNTQECAMFIGMCQNPAFYNPRRRPEQTKYRRNVVLNLMADANFITKQEADSLKKMDIELKFKKVDHNEGLAPYFREYLRQLMNTKKPDKSKYLDKEQYYGDSINWDNNPLYGWINKNVKADGSKYSLTADGLKIYTTINSKMQTYAEASVKEHLSKFLQPRFDKEKEGSEFAPYARSVGKAKFDRLMNKSMKNSDRYRNLRNAGMSESAILETFKEPIEMKVFSWEGEKDTIMTPYDSIRYHKQFLRTGFMAMDTHSGAVRAYVGDIDYSYFKYDMVNKSRRQVGSTFKPFLYTLAMEEGLTPCDEMMHVEQVLHDENGRPWRPKNAGAKRVGEMVTIKWGLQNSSNWVTAYLMGRTSPYALMRLLRTFGIMGDIDPVVSMCLGTDGIMVSEMASAYTAFANKGMRSDALYVTRIEDQHGNVIAEFQPRQQELFNETTYARMLDMLRAVIDGGTGGRARRNYGLMGDMGGKTGTTNDNIDGWFMGFTPSLSTATWVGGEERDIHFGSMANGQGAASALPIFGLFMQKVYADPTLTYTQDQKFEQVSGVQICPSNDSIEETTTTIIDDIFD